MGEGSGWEGAEWVEGAGWEGAEWVEGVNAVESDYLLVE